MKLQIRTKEGLKEFEAELNMITYDIYYETFRRDFHVDTVNDFTVNGAYGRAYLQRVMYAMIKTVDIEFMDFYSFLLSLEDNISNFLDNIDKDLIDLINSKITNSPSKELADDKITN